MRRWHDKKTRVERCRALSVTALRNAGVFKAGWISGSMEWKNRFGEVAASVGFQFSQHPAPHVRISYTLGNGDAKKDIDYAIDMQTTPCNFGGLRYWFTCPLVKNNQPCQRRAGVIYLPPGGRYFGC